MTDLQYPIGRFQMPDSVSGAARLAGIRQIAELPARLRAAVAGLTEAQLDAPYRPDGWTVRQVVHHVADSHINAYVRLKLGLTESEPLIKTYEEALWANLPDSRAPIGNSLDLLEALHRRWVLLLEQTPAADLARTVRHPDLGLVRLEQLMALYAWHGPHHVAHVTGLRERMGWGS
jgi:uncharacterized damage-inducible protein DinB